MVELSTASARFQAVRPFSGRTLEQAARVAVEEVLGVSAEERVLLVTHPDPQLSRIAMSIHDAVSEVGAEPVLVATRPRKGAELADPVLIRALETDPNVLVLLTNGRIGGDPERLARPIHGTFTHYLQYLLSQAPTRGFWCQGVQQASFARGVTVDHPTLRAATQGMVESLRDAVELRITTGKGMELVVPVGGDAAREESGDYKAPGASGELPTGEVFVPVVPEGTSGRLRVTGGLGLPEETLSLREPLVVDFEHGELVKVHGEGPARRLEAALADAERQADQAVREGWLTQKEAQGVARSTHHVKEVAFGLNPGLKPRGDPVADAKARGVVRVVLGAGLREVPPGAPVSLELVVPGSKVTMVATDGTESPLMEGGRLAARSAVRPSVR